METSSEPLRQDAWLSPLWYWAPVFGYAALIFYFSSQSHPEEQLPQFLMQEVSDKVLHAVEYAVLGVLCYRGFRWAAGPAADFQGLEKEALGLPRVGRLWLVVGGLRLVQIAASHEPQTTNHFPS